MKGYSTCCDHHRRIAHLVHSLDYREHLEEQLELAVALKRRGRENIGEVRTGRRKSRDGKLGLHAVFAVASVSGLADATELGSFGGSFIDTVGELGAVLGDVAAEIRSWSERGRVESREGRKWKNGKKNEHAIYLMRKILEECSRLRSRRTAPCKHTDNSRASDDKHSFRAQSTRRESGKPFLQKRNT